MMTRSRGELGSAIDMKSTVCFFLGHLVVGAALAAQQVWIVDALNRPGTHFTAIQPAVDAATPGDVVRVRDARPLVAAYAGATVNRGIALIGDPRVVLHSKLAIRGVPAGESCRVVAIDIDGFSGTGLVVSGCSGPVHIESVSTLPSGFVFFTTPTGVEVSGSSHVTFTRCRFLALTGMACGSSAVAISDSVIEARGYQEALGGPGLSVGNSRVVLAGTTVVGASTNSCCVPQRPPQPGISAGRSTLFVTGSRTRIAGGGVLASPCGCNQPADGLVADAATTVFVGNAQGFTARGGTLVPRPLPSLIPVPNATRTSVTWALEGPVNAAFATLLGFPGGPITFSFGDLWLDLARPHVSVDAGVLTAGTRNHTQPIPGGLPAALVIACQSALLDAGVVRTSTPAITVVD